VYDSGVASSDQPTLHRWSSRTPRPAERSFYTLALHRAIAEHAPSLVKLASIATSVTSLSIGLLAKHAWLDHSNKRVLSEVASSLSVKEVCGWHGPRHQTGNASRSQRKNVRTAIHHPQSGKIALLMSAQNASRGVRKRNVSACSRVPLEGRPLRRIRRPGRPGVLQVRTSAEWRVSCE
jgi:hypothetical protein